MHFESISSRSISCPRPSKSNEQPEWEVVNISNHRRNISDTTVRIIVKLADEGKSLKTIQAKYKWYQPRYLERLRKQLTGEEPKSLQEKIDDYAEAQVIEMRNHGKVVRGYMIKSWAIRKARELGYNQKMREDN